MVQKNDSEKRDQHVMTKEEFIYKIEEKQIIATAKLDAYRNVIESIKRMHESSERKVKEAKVAMAKSGDTSNVNPKLKQKALQAQAARDVYCEVLMDVAKAAKECKDALMQDVREFNEVFDAIYGKHPTPILAV